MRVPGLRIMLRTSKRNAFWALAFVACSLIVVVVFSPDLLQRDVRSIGFALPADQQSNGAAAKAPDGQGNSSGSQNLHDLELAKFKLENELLSEKLKAEKLTRELEEAIRQKDANPMAGQQQPHNSFQRRQFVRQGTIQQACGNHNRIPGAIHTLIPSRTGVTYCLIPRSYQAFWLKVYRFFNRDFVEDVQTPLDLGTKSAIERPFIRTKLLRWPRVPLKDKSDLLNTKIVLAVENPYERLYNIYVNSFILPELWGSEGVKIEEGRKPVERDIDHLVGGRKQFKILCGGNITFSEFLSYALKSDKTDYAPVYQLCDACQLNPAFVVKTETAREDTQSVLSHFNLAWVVQANDYENQTAIRYIKTTINDNFDRLQMARKHKCGTPTTLGVRLWKAFVMEGLFPQSSQYPSIEEQTTKESLIEAVTNNYLKYSRSKVNVRTLKVGQMITAYNFVDSKIVDQIQRKYIMDFQLLGYSKQVDDIDKEAY